MKKLCEVCVILLFGISYLTYLRIDFTAATLLSKFSDQKVAESVERVLKLVTEPKAREIFAVSWDGP